MNFYYWSPFLSEVATVKAVLNSAHSLSKYSKGNFKPYIINSVGEWTSFKDEIKDKQIGLIDFCQKNFFYKNLPRFGYIKSRYSYLLIILKSYRKLYKFLKSKGKNDYIIIHLISSLPLIYLILFKFECKFILRISGFPKLNIFRKLLWKIISKKLHLVFCPTEETRNSLIELGVFSEDKIVFLPDPIVKISTINFKKRKNEELNLPFKDYFVSVGRLSKQKNQMFLINFFKNNFENENLLIIGDGELKDELSFKIKSNNLQKRIILIPYKKNIFNIIANSKAVLVSSLWEDPGFVMIESAAIGKVVVISDCPSGPKEFIDFNKNGFIFKSNNEESFLESLNSFFKKSDHEIKKIKVNAKKKSKIYTQFNHYKILKKNLDF